MLMMIILINSTADNMIKTNELLDQESAKFSYFTNDL